MQRPPSLRRDQILEACINYILDHGVADLSLRPLAAAVGSKARLLIYHFGSKDALLAEAMLLVRGRTQLAFAKSLSSGAVSQPTQIIRAFWHWATSRKHERYLHLFFEIHGLALHRPAMYRQYLRGAVTSWVEMFAEVLPQKISRSKRLQLSSVAAGTVFGLLLDFLSSGDKKRTAEALDLFVDEFEIMLAKHR